MALSRSRRSNAGSKMAMLLNTMESDDFYTTTYGGFNEEDADADFLCEAAPVTATTTADIDDDIVDSDFSIDENDEPRSDVENDDDPDKPKRLKRALGVQTKAYKEPKRDQLKPKKSATVSTTPSASSFKTQKLGPRPRLILSSSDVGRKLTRASTVSKTVETVKRQRERAMKAKKLLKKKMTKKLSTNTRPLTQEELLEEAKETELLNIESLKRFQQMEIEAKQQALRTSTRSIKGPCVQYRSTTMPLSQISPKKILGSPNSDVKICVDDADDSKEGVTNDKDEEEDSGQVMMQENDEKFERQERTFITFSDFDTFRENFPIPKKRETQQKLCPITRLPAKYFDPVTKLPYANLQAFRILREAYYSQLELKGDKNDPEVAAWLEWRQKNKPSKPPILTQITRPPAAFSHLLANATPIRTASPAIPTPIPLAMTPVMRHPTTTIVMTTTASPAIIQSGRTLIAQQQQVQQQQSIVLPARSTPLTQSPIPVTQLIQTSQASMVSPSMQTAGAIQTVKIGGQTSQMIPRTVTTLTQAQLQSLTARGGTNLQSIQNVLRSTGVAAPRAQLITRPTMSTPTGIMRPQTVTGQVTLQPQTRPHAIALSRPGGVTAQTIALQSASGIRASTGQILVTPGGTAAGRQVVVTSSGQPRQIVMTTQGGSVRPGQILQVTQGGQQHQIVVSQSGLILNPQTKQQ